MTSKDILRIITAEGEGQKIEFKAKPSGLANEMAAFANASGGSIYLGIADDSQIVGVSDSNRLRSQIQDIANNCDPRISIRIVAHGRVIEIVVPEGSDKPYRSNDGFFLRTGPNSQQLTRDEIFRFAIKSNKIRFDEQFESTTETEDLIDQNKIIGFLIKRGLSEKTKTSDLLINLGLAQKQQNRLLLTRAAFLFFGRDPQTHFPEAFVTCALYGDETRAKVLDRLDVKGTLEDQFEKAVSFIRRNLRIGYRIENAGPREEKPEVPETVFREALLNALTHRDYFADTTHIYVHMYPGRIEIINPGGLPQGLSFDEFGRRAVTRNRLIADIFYRLGYVERLGSGIHRMCEAMAAEHLPVPQFYPTPNSFRVDILSSFISAGLTPGEVNICQWLSSKGKSSIKDFVAGLHISKASVHRRLTPLLKQGWIETKGAGPSTKYQISNAPRLRRP